MEALKALAYPEPVKKLKIADYNETIRGSSQGTFIQCVASKYFETTLMYFFKDGRDSSIYLEDRKEYVDACVDDNDGTVVEVARDGDTIWIVDCLYLRHKPIESSDVVTRCVCAQVSMQSLNGVMGKYHVKLLPVYKIDDPRVEGRQMYRPICDPFVRYI